RMDDRLDPLHASGDECPVPDRTDRIGEGRSLDVDAARVAPRLTQCAHQALAEMTGAAGDQDRHGGLMASIAARRRERARQFLGENVELMIETDADADTAVEPRRHRLADEDVARQ